MSDLCWTCQQNSHKIMKAINKSTNEKSQVSTLHYTQTKTMQDHTKCKLIILCVTILVQNTHILLIQVFKEFCNFIFTVG